MTYTVLVTENATGETRPVTMEGSWDSPGRFWWNEGNGACDCNRHLAFHGWPEDVEGEFDIDCGHDRYAVEVIDAARTPGAIEETGRMG